MTEQEVFVYSEELTASYDKQDSKAVRYVTDKIIEKYFGDLSGITVSNITEPMVIFALREFLQVVESNADEDSLILADKLQENISIGADIIIK